MRPALYGAETSSVDCTLALTMYAAPVKAETIQVTIDKLAFSPATVEAKVGDTIVWVNKDVFAHTATVKDGWDVMIPATTRQRRRGRRGPRPVPTGLGWPPARGEDLRGGRRRRPDVGHSLRRSTRSPTSTVRSSPRTRYRRR